MGCRHAGRGLSSTPKTTQNGQWRIVPGLTMSEETKRRLPATIDELVEERALALSLVAPPPASAAARGRAGSSSPVLAAHL